MSEKISNRMMERNWSSKKDDEIERLRGLLKRSLFHLIVDCRDDDLLEEIKKEVGDA